MDSNSGGCLAYCCATQRGSTGAPKTASRTVTKKQPLMLRLSAATNKISKPARRKQEQAVLRSWAGFEKHRERLRAVARLALEADAVLNGSQHKEDGARLAPSWKLCAPPPVLPPRKLRQQQALMTHCGMYSQSSSGKNVSRTSWCSRKHKQSLTLATQLCTSSVLSGWWEVLAFAHNWRLQPTPTPTGRWDLAWPYLTSRVLPN